MYEDYDAFCIDQACYLWGSFVEHELESASADPKEKRNPKVQQAAARRRNAQERLLFKPIDVEAILHPPKKELDAAEEPEPQAQSAPSKFRDIRELIGKSG